MQVSRIAPLIAAAAFGCSPFDPNLGAQPFLCANTPPRCPEGYVCVGDGSDAACTLSNAAPDAGGGDSGLQCDVDSDREPNDTTETATSIPQAGSNTTLDAVLCPETDVDIYQLMVDTTGESIRVDVSYDSSHGPLVIDLLNSTGLVIRSATKVGNDPDHMRVDFENLASGMYYGRVQAMDAAFRANYQASFLVSAGPLPP